MIRVIIALLVLFLIWVLFLSNLTKRRKIIITIITILLALGGLYYDGATRSAKLGVVSLAELEICGVTSQHTYRSNFNIQLCLNNTHPTARVSRVSYVVTVKDCTDSGSCQQIARVTSDTLADIAPQSQAKIVQNLDFKGVDPTMNNLRWQAEVLTVKAMK